MNKQELETEVARLKCLLEEALRKNMALQGQVEAMRQQEANMARIHRGMPTRPR